MAVAYYWERLVTNARLVGMPLMADPLMKRKNCKYGLRSGSGLLGHQLRSMTPFSNTIWSADVALQFPSIVTWCRQL